MSTLVPQKSVVAGRRGLSKVWKTEDRRLGPKARAIARKLAVATGIYRRLKGPDQSAFRKDFDDAKLSSSADPMSALFYAHDGRFISKWDHYLPIYDRHLSRYRGTPVRILEIGVSQGGSLQLWRKYFGPDALIYGIDNSPVVLGINDPDLNIRVGSQADQPFLREVVAEMGGVDVVIDDGSHRAHHQRASYEALMPLVSENGVYICEDLLTSYWPGVWRGGLKRRGTFIEVCKDIVDRLNSWHHGKSPQPEATTVNSVHFYDGIAVIEKQPRGRPFVVTTGELSFVPSTGELLGRYRVSSSTPG